MFTFQISCFFPMCCRENIKQPTLPESLRKYSSKRLPSLNVYMEGSINIEEFIGEEDNDDIEEFEGDDESSEEESDEYE